MNVSVRDLKNGLSSYLRKVRGGERVVVTDRGRPVAELRALDDSEVTPEERLRRLAELGEVTLAGGAKLLDVEPIRLRRGPSVATTLLEDRGR